MSVVQKLKKKNLIQCPPWLPNQIAYETYMGSVAYSVAEDKSDIDLYGFAIPTKDILFPYSPSSGNIFGFGRKPETFEQYQQHHIVNKEESKEYDLSIYNIVRYFQLLTENNPNIVDSIFTPLFCVTHSTKVGNMVRDNRKIFLHKGSYFKFLGYAKSMLHKSNNKVRVNVDDLKAFQNRNNIEGTYSLEEVQNEIIGGNPYTETELARLPKDKLKEYESLIKNLNKRDLDNLSKGYDSKYFYHLARLADEADCILTHGDLILGRNKEFLKSIRRGETGEEEIRTWFSEQEKYLHKLYTESKLQDRPDEDEIKQLLIDCLEEHYGNLQDSVIQPDQFKNALKQIKEITERLDV